MIRALDHQQLLRRAPQRVEQPLALIRRHDGVARAGDHQHRAADEADPIQDAN